jgi:hypothetical protein
MGRQFDFSQLDDEAVHPYGAEPGEYKLAGTITADGGWYCWDDPGHDSDLRLEKGELCLDNAVPGVTIPLRISSADGSPTPFSAGSIRVRGADLAGLLAALGVSVANGRADLVPALTGASFDIYASEGFGGRYNHEHLEVKSLGGNGGVFSRGR